MKTGKVAQILDLDPQTVKNWVALDMLAEFFSDGAKGKGQMQREFTDGDLSVLNTIRTLRISGNNNWHSIAETLRAGHRDTTLPAGGITVNTGETPIDLVKKSMATTVERDNAIAHVKKLEDQLDEYEKRLAEAEREKDRIRDELTEQIMKLREEKAAELARAQTELELWRSGRLKPSKNKPKELLDGK
jgi:DNA-binding transcriptional MerR regulator